MKSQDTTVRPKLLGVRSAFGFEPKPGPRREIDSRASETRGGTKSIDTLLGEQRGDERRELERPAALVGVARAELDARTAVAVLAARPGDHLVDRQLAILEIDVVPAQAFRFTRGRMPRGDG